MLPVFATVWLVLFFVEWITGPASTLIGPGVPQLLSFAVTIFFITVIGFFAKNYVGKVILDTVESIIIRIPIIGTIYNSSKQIISAFSLNNKKNLVPVMIEYPRQGLWALGFITQESVAGITTEEGQQFGEDKVAVFVPTTPNPTSGFLLMVPKKDLIYLDVSFEQASKFIVSAGTTNID